MCIGWQSSWCWVLEQVPVQLPTDWEVLRQRLISPVCSGQQLVNVRPQGPVWKWVWTDGGVPVQQRGLMWHIMSVKCTRQ